jgi:hypothetical protein
MRRARMNPARAVLAALLAVFSLVGGTALLIAATDSNPPDFESYTMSTGTGAGVRVTRIGQTVCRTSYGPESMKTTCR